MTDRKVWFITGTGSIGRTEHKVADLEEQIDAYRDQLTSLTLNDLQSTEDRR
jgi:hypothetical protein